MPNSDLINKLYKIPDNVTNKVKHMLAIIHTNDKQAKGVKRAKDLVDNKKISYGQMKRLKSYFDSYKGDGKDDEYKLIGGKVTRKWVDNALKTDRESIKTNKKVKMDGGMENQFIKTHEKDNENTNVTASNGGMIDVAKSMDSRAIMHNSAVYKESYNKEIKTIKYLIEYLSK